VIAPSKESSSKSSAVASPNAILWYFADGTRYLPEDGYERAQVLQWMFFEQYKHEPGIAVVRFWVSISDDPPPAADVEKRRAVGRAALDVMEGHLGDREYFVGEGLSIADVALYASLIDQRGLTICLLLSRLSDQAKTPNRPARAASRRRRWRRGA